MPTSTVTSPKPTLPPFWKWLMRITFAVTMALFLAPAVYVVKYYALDLPREIALPQPHQLSWRKDPHNPDDLLAEAKTANEPLVKSFLLSQLYQITAIR